MICKFEWILSFGFFLYLSLYILCRHFLIQAVSILMERGDDRIKNVSICPTNSEKFKAFTINNFWTFKDTYAFIGISFYS